MLFLFQTRLQLSIWFKHDKVLDLLLTDYSRNIAGIRFNLEGDRSRCRLKQVHTTSQSRASGVKVSLHMTLEA